jgi:hypothetical protein
MNAQLHLAIVTIGLCLLIAFIGCGGEDLVINGMLPNTPVVTGTPTCLDAGETCVLASDCCSGQCTTPDGVTLQCQ